MRTSQRIRRALHTALALLVLYVGLCAVVWVVQRRLIYFPGGASGITPDTVGLHYEEVLVPAVDGPQIHGWWFPALRGEPLGAVLVFHGNAGNIEHRIPLARALAAMQLDVLLFDYRGYGRSEGSPSERGLYSDGEAMHEWLVQREAKRGLPADRVAYFGESLGGAVAIELASRRPVAAVVTEAAFTSVADVARGVYWFLPVDLLLRDRFTSIDKIARVSAPILVMHSPDDEVVPFKHSERLIAAASSAALLRLDAGHNDGGFQRATAYVLAVQEFLHRHLRQD